MKAFFEAIINFFRRLFSSDSGGPGGSGGGVTGNQTAPPDQGSISYFFYKVATQQTTFNAFSAPSGAVPTVQNDPDLTGENKQKVIAALNLGGYQGYQSMYNAMAGEANSGSAVVWICIWIVAPRR